MIRKSRNVIVTVFLSAVAGATLWVYAGSLTPPAGPVAPTMKTLDQLSAQITALQAPVKRVIRGVISFTSDQAVMSQAISASPAIGPAKCVVMLSEAVATTYSPSTTPIILRNGASLVSLTESQITVRVDINNLIPVDVSYQIIEYN